MTRDSKPTCSWCSYIRRGVEAMGRLSRQGDRSRGKNYNQQLSVSLFATRVSPIGPNQCGYALHLEGNSQGVHTLFFPRGETERGKEREGESQSKEERE